MSVKLLTEHHLELLSLKGGCLGSSESTLVKMPHCWKSRVAVQLILLLTHNSMMDSFRFYKDSAILNRALDFHTNLVGAQ